MTSAAAEGVSERTIMNQTGHRSLPIVRLYPWRRARHPGLRLPDALVVATGSVLGAAVVLTGDAHWRQLGQAISIL